MSTSVQHNARDDSVDALYATQLLPPLSLLLSSSSCTAAGATAATATALLAQHKDDVRDELTRTLYDVLAAHARQPQPQHEQPCRRADDAAVVTTLMTVRHALLLHEQQQQQQQQHPQSTSHDKDSDSTRCATAATAHALERLFVLLSTTVLSAHALQLQQQQHNASKSSSGSDTAAKAAMLPVGIAHATRALAEGVYALPYLLEYIHDNSNSSKNNNNDTEAVARRQHIREAVCDVWHACLFIFLQQLALRNGTDVTAWSCFFDDCRNAVAAAAHDDDDDKKSSSSSSSHEKKDDDDNDVDASIRVRTWRLPRVQAACVRRAAAAALGEVTSELFAHTIARGRFRRAAVRFRASSPHLIAQAPGTSGVLVVVLLEFCRVWHRTLRTRPPGSMSHALQRRLAALLDRTDDEADTSTAADNNDDEDEDDEDECMSEDDVALLSLIDHYRAQWVRLVGESTVHSYLLATVLGSVLCAYYILPQTRNATAAASGASTTTTTSSSSSSSGATAPRQRATLASIHASKGHDSGSGAFAASRDDNNTDDKSSSSSSNGTGTAMLEAASWLRVRPSSSSCGEVEWRVRSVAPLGLFFVLPREQHAAPRDTRRTREHVCDARLLLRPHVYYLATQLRIGLVASHHVEGRQKFAMCALLSGLCDVATALGIYANAASSSTTTTTAATATDGPVSTTAATANSVSDATSVLARYTALVDRYAATAESELVLHTSPQQQQQQSSSSSSSLLLHSERFCQMRYREPLPPPWPQYVATLHSLRDTTATTTTTTTTATHDGLAAAMLQATQPCHFVLALLAARYYSLAARTIAHVLVHDKENVYLVTRQGLPPHHVSVQVYVVDAVTRALQQQGSATRRTATTTTARASDDDEDDDATRLECALRELLPLLQLTQTYAASQTLLCTLLSRLVVLCRTSDSSSSSSSCTENKDDNNNVTAHGGSDAVTRRRHRRQQRQRLSLVEAVLVYFVLPCLRVLSPSHAVHAQLQRLLVAWRRCAGVVCYGDGAASFAHMRMWCAQLLPRSLLAQQQQQRQRQQYGSQTTVRRSNNKHTDDEDVVARGLDTLPSVRYAHDVLHTVEATALFLQTLKRLNASRVSHYRRLLRPVLFAHPLFVAERILQQAVGYENSFVRVHTQLLSRLPASCVTLLLQLGLAYAQHYADTHDEHNRRSNSGGGGSSGVQQQQQQQQQQRQGGRVAHVATFLAALLAEYARVDCRNDNSHGGGGNDSVDGIATLLRAAEAALRCYSRAGLLLGSELLRALLLQLAHVRLEHEERFSDVQCRALTAARTTRFFARGAAESYRVTRWCSAQTSPRHLARTRNALVTALLQPVTECTTSGKSNNNSNSNDSTSRDAQTSLSLGQCLLLHLCRLHADVHSLQADLDGTMNEVMLTNAKDADVLCDEALALTSLLPRAALRALPTWGVFRVATPAMMLCLTGRYHNNNDNSNNNNNNNNNNNSSSNDTQDDEASAQAWRVFAEANTAVPLSLLRTLSTLTARHLVYDEDVYAAAQREVQASLTRATATAIVTRTAAATTTSTRDSGVTSCAAATTRQRQARVRGQAARTVTWLRTQAQCIAAEREQHRTLYDGYAAQRRALLRALCRFVRSSAAAASSLALSYLLPRVLLSYREAQCVSALLTWLLREARATAATTVAATASDDTTPTLSLAEATAAVDLALCCATAAATFLVAYTDGESARVGCLLNAIVSAAAAADAKTAMTAATTQQETPSAAVLSFVQRHRQQQQEGDGARAAAATTSHDNDSDATVTRNLVALVDVATRATRAAHDAHAQQQTTTAATTTTTTTSDVAWPLQLEAYMTRAAVEVLQRSDDVPAHVQRNLLTILASVLRAPSWPCTRAACTLLQRAVTPHADERLANYASASAVLKTLRARAQARRVAVAPLTACAAQLAYTAGDVVACSSKSNSSSSSNGGDEDAEHVAQLQHWLHTRRVYEGYMRELLADVVVVGDAAAPATASTSTSPTVQAAAETAAAAADDDEDDVAVDDDGDIDRHMSSSSSSLLLSATTGGDDTHEHAHSDDNDAVATMTTERATDAATAEADDDDEAVALHSRSATPSSRSSCSRSRSVAGDNDDDDDNDSAHVPPDTGDDVQTRKRARSTDDDEADEAAVGEQ